VVELFPVKKFQISLDLVVKLQLVDIIALMCVDLTIARRVSLGHHGGSCPSFSVGSCSPHNPMECGMTG
jgi:hypothetical protein